MKVLAINGSPRPDGCTAATLRLMTEEIENAGIEVDTVHIGKGPIRGCSGDGACRKLTPVRCVHDDIVNVCIEKSESAEGLILACPVHYSGIPGDMKSFLDRFFHAGGRERLGMKVGAAAVSLRRSGGVATYDQLIHYFTISNMVVTSSRYWNVIHGTDPGMTLSDEEGVEILRTAGRSMAHVLKKLYG